MNINLKTRNINMKRLTPIIILLLTLSPVMATMGIGVTPADIEIDFAQEPDIYKDIEITLTNNGNTELAVTPITETIYVEFPFEVLELPACSCLGFCNPEVVNCDMLYRPEVFTVRIYKHVEDEVLNGKIIFSGFTVNGTDAMVTTGAKTTINVHLYDYSDPTITTTPTTTIPTTTQPSSGGGGGGNYGITTQPTTSTSTTSSTTTVAPITTLPKVVVIDDRVITDPEEIRRLSEELFAPTEVTSTTTPQVVSEQPAGLAHFFLQTTAGFYTILAIILVVVLGIIFIVQWKKRVGNQNPLLKENQGIQNF
jgi:hypothetical protein